MMAYISTTGTGGYNPMTDVQIVLPEPEDWSITFQEAAR